MENFAEIITNNQAKCINKISDEIGKKLENEMTNSSINKKAVRQAGESTPPSESKVNLDSGSDLDKQIVRLLGTTKNAPFNFAFNNDGSESRQSDEDDIINDIARF